jgi:glycosyltransferase involved in cell wall biosynthesis
MKLLFVADARSPISRCWIEHFVETGHDVNVISTYPCPPDILCGAAIHHVPIAFSRLSQVKHNGSTGNQGQSRRTAALASLRVGALSGLSLAMRSWFSPMELLRHVDKTRKLISEISPDIVHALRIPFEGILASKAVPANVPLLLSVWGNDFTLFAARNPLIGRQTKSALQRADALLCDCDRDLQLAFTEWGFQREKPGAVLPSAGGVSSPFLESNKESESMRRAQLNINDAAPVIFNPRGFRQYVRNDIFFKAIRLVINHHPDAVFLCIGMLENPVAEKWVARQAVEKNVRLLPMVDHDSMATLFRISDIAVSPSLHDGTPNSLLEAMACGCFPVTGAIESMKEWIIDGENGLLCDPESPESLANAILRAVQDRDLRKRAAEINQQLIRERAEYNSIMRRAEEFYARVTGRSHQVLGV